MSTDGLMRILLRLAIAFVAFQIVLLVVGLGFFVFFALGGGVFGGHDHPSFMESTP